MKKLAIITTHPIQYNAPLFRLMNKRGNIEVKVFYTWGEDVLKNKFDPGFGKNIEWDIPLLEGYEYEFVKNVASDPGSHHFKGIDNPALVNEILKWNADAILIYGWNFKSHLRCLKYFHKKIPVYFRGDSTLSNQPGKIKSFFRKFVLTWVYRHVDKAFYVGSKNKKYFLNYGLNEDQLVFAPHAIDNRRFIDEEGLYEEKAKMWREQLGIFPDEIVIVYAGKLEPIKNLEWLIQVIREIEDLPIKLIIAGNGPSEKLLKQQANGDAKILFIDFQNQKMMPVVYRLGEVFILCSHSETWGLSINEAMASGRAILASETTGCAVDLLVNGVNGYVFKLPDKNDLINKIRTFATDKHFLKNMGAESQKIISGWNFEIVCKAIENTVETINKKQN